MTSLFLMFTVVGRGLLREICARDGSGYAVDWHRFKHKILTPSFVLFVDNGIDHPCHNYG